MLEIRFLIHPGSPISWCGRRHDPRPDSASQSLASRDSRHAAIPIRTVASPGRSSQHERVGVDGRPHMADRKLLVGQALAG